MLSNFVEPTEFWVSYNGNKATETLFLRWKEEEEIEEEDEHQEQHRVGVRGLVTGG